MSTWRRRISEAAANRRARRVVVLMTILGFLAVVSGSTIAAYVSQRSEIAAMREQVREQQKQVAELHAEMTRWEDPAYVEQQARQRLKFVRPGERAYTVLDPADPTRVAEVEVDIAAPTKGQPWYAAVLQSAAVADAPLPAAP